MKNGYSLIEMLVVLAISALIISVVGGWLLLPNRKIDHQAITQHLINDLRIARQRAMDPIIFDKSIPSMIRISTEGWLRSWDEKVTRLPSHETIELLPVGQGNIAFFHDGSSEGGTIILDSGNQKTYIKIDRVLGRISINDKE